MSNYNSIVISRIAKVAQVKGYGCVKDGVNTVDVPDAANELCAGIVEYDQPDAGSHVGVQMNGTCDFAVAGGVIADGAQVIMGADGRFITLPTDVDGVYNVFGQAQNGGATAAGKLFELLILQRIVTITGN
jgi:hypothetical protein